MQFFDKNDNQNYVLRIPTNAGRRLFVYYRRYKNSLTQEATIHTKKTIYQMFQKSAAKKQEEAPKDKKLGGITLKTISNPLIAPKEEVVPKTDEEILDNMRSNRTLFVYNFDTEFEVAHVKTWFKTMGKIRHVFTGTKYTKKAAAKMGKQLYFALVEYREPKDLKTCFDHPEVVQERITNVLKSMNIKVDDEAKLNYQENLVKQYAAEELNGDKNEFVDRMEEDGFRVVMDHAGGFNKFDNGFGREDEDGKTAEDYENELPKKKKKSLQQDNFYRFQVKNNAAMQAIGYQHFKNPKYHDAGENVIGMKIHDLKKGFQEDVAKLKELRKKKAIKNQVNDDGDE